MRSIFYSKFLSFQLSFTSHQVETLEITILLRIRTNIVSELKTLHVTPQRVAASAAGLQAALVQNSDPSTDPVRESRQRRNPGKLDVPGSWVHWPPQPDGQTACQSEPRGCHVFRKFRHNGSCSGEKQKSWVHLSAWTTYVIHCGVDSLIPRN